MEGASAYSAQKLTEGSSVLQPESSTPYDLTLMTAISSADDRPLRADAQRNRDRLLEAAVETFAEQGIDGSLEAVARRAGVGIGTLYRHFPTREALVEAILRQRFERLARHADELQAAVDPFDALREWLRDLLVHAATFKGIAGSVKETMHDPQSPLGAACKASHDGWRGLLARAQERGLVREDVEPMDVLRLVYGIAWMAEQARDEPRVEEMLGLVLDGLRPVAT